MKKVISLFCNTSGIFMSTLMFGNDDFTADLFKPIYFGSINDGRNMRGDMQRISIDLNIAISEAKETLRMEE